MLLLETLGLLKTAFNVRKPTSSGQILWCTETHMLLNL